MRVRSVDQVEGLLSVSSSDDLESWLIELTGFDVLADDCSWRNVGDQRSNAGPIEASADEINPLVERVINSIEAVIELQILNAGVTPGSPRAAIETLFHVPRGESRRLDEEQARELAQHVSVMFRGTGLTSSPTIEVRDKGVGIHPSVFSDTILALGQSDKGQKDYLVGMYGQGGSSTFDKCEYTVIVSRRHPDHLSDEQHDEVGWTIVRKSLNVRAPVYSYLVDPDTQTVPVFSGSIADVVGLVHGTAIAHIGYRGTGGFGNSYITNSAWYTLNFRVFDPLLPWTLVDRREGVPANYRSRTMRGVPYRVAQRPRVGGIGTSERSVSSGTSAVRHHVAYRHELPSGSHLTVKWWIMQDEQVQEGRRRRRHDRRVMPYRDRTRRYARRVIAITRGGQTHAALTNSIFNKKRLRQLARSIIAQVDTDGMTYEEGASFFASNRADLKSESEDLIEEAINAAIDLHIGELREIEREREQEIVAGSSASDEQSIRQYLDPMIRAFQRIQTGPGSVTDHPQQGNRQFRGQQIPTILRFARNRPLEVRPGVLTRVDLLTDAADEVMTDQRTEVRIVPSRSGIRISSPQGQSGRYRINLLPDADLPVGTRIELSASVAQAGAWYRAADRPCQLIVVAPPPPYVGIDPATFIRFRSQNGAVHVMRGGARVSLETDARNDLTANGARLSVNSPAPDLMPVSGLSGPTDGLFRVGLRVPNDAPLGNAGTITAQLSLEDGTRLVDHSDLIVEPRPDRNGQTETIATPNYEIKDVQQIPTDQDQASWSDMAAILGVDEPWNGDDVGAFVETGEGANPMVSFYLNVDNGELRRIEGQIAQRQSESAVDAFRARHRTLLCFHLYKLAIRNNSGEISDYDYREEMIRVSETLLFTHRQFMDNLEVDDD